uniref:Uncharacterized protein n=1 Tax=Ditylenchus dipsaci TaxID=166011 RepID=A0A915CWM2_9BILA
MNILEIADYALPCIAVDRMNNYLFNMLCSTLHEMTEYEDVHIAVRHFIKELEKFAQDDFARINKIQDLWERVPQQ